MGETFTDHPARHEASPADLLTVAEVAMGLTEADEDTRPLVTDYIRYLDTQKDLESLPADEQLAIEPYHARQFVQHKVLTMDFEVVRDYHRLLAGPDTNWRVIDVDAQIDAVIRQYGTFGRKLERQLPDGSTDREWYMDQQIKYAVQPEHYHRYPEILAAYRLAEQLRDMQLEGMADSVDILLAAQGRELHNLPIKDKSLPRGALTAIIRQQNPVAAHQYPGH